jgi:hypothetical protein
MKIELSDRAVRMWLVAFGLTAWGAATAFSQDAVYAARVSSASTTNWDAPFYWINCGAYSPYGTSTRQSAATDPVSTPTRDGCYWHTANLLSVGEGFGLVHVKGTQEGAVYEVDVTQPSYQVASDIMVNVGSTNCDIGAVFGATADGGWTNATAFQAAHSADQWGRVCYLTNRPGVAQPHVDFKYVSGGIGSNRNYADCVRFHLIGYATIPPTSVQITRFADTALEYAGGSGTRFVLLQCAGLCDWQRVATNLATPGSFTIPAVGTGAASFYTIASE